MLYLFFTILGFALGSTLFAYWTPKIIRHIDIRELPADHNPGVANAFMYGGFFCGLLSLILELAKGFVPVFLGQRFLDTHSLLFIPVLIAPVFGHAFPFFRKEKGGKAITASFGVLLGLFPEMRPAVYLAFFFIFFSLIVVVACKDLLPAELLHRKKSPYPKTYHPGYEKLLIAEMQHILDQPDAPVKTFIDTKKLETFLEAPTEYGKPWFGQLMAGPQLLAYFIQINYWMQKYHLNL